VVRYFNAAIWPTPSVIKADSTVRNAVMPAPKKPKGNQYPRKTIPCRSGPSIDEQGRSYAELLTSPELAAYRVIAMMQPKSFSDDIDSPTLLETLRDQSAAANKGDLSHAEAMLMNQASSLQALFVRLSERAMEQSHMPHLEGFMRMALRSQNQCRMTLETLATIKNPPVIYAKQANIANGPQQVNNATVPQQPAHAVKNQNQQNELLEAHPYEPLDTRAPGTPSRVDPAMATVGAIDGATDTSREGGFVA
jgi:hypothetical protein